MFVASTISRAKSVSASSRASPRARVPSDVSWSSPSKKGFGVLTRCVVTARGRGRVRASASRPRDDRVAPAPTLADAIDPPETALVTLARRHVARRYDRESARHLLGSLRAHGVETAADLRQHLLSHALPRLAGQAGQILVISLGAWAAIAAQSHVARHGGHLDVSTAVAWFGLGAASVILAVHAATSAVPTTVAAANAAVMTLEPRAFLDAVRESAEETDAKTMRTNAAEAARNARREARNNVVAAERRGGGKSSRVPKSETRLEIADADARKRR